MTCEKDSEVAANARVIHKAWAHENPYLGPAEVPDEEEEDEEGPPAGVKAEEEAIWETARVCQSWANQLGARAVPFYDTTSTDTQPSSGTENDSPVKVKEDQLDEEVPTGPPAKRLKGEEEGLAGPPSFEVSACPPGPTPSSEDRRHGRRRGVSRRRIRAC